MFLTPTEAAQKALIEGEAKGKREGKREGKIEGKREGKREGKIETARVLLSMGMDLSIISKATDLSEEQILSLKEPSIE